MNIIKSTLNLKQHLPQEAQGFVVNRQMEE